MRQIARIAFLTLLAPCAFAFPAAAQTAPAPAPAGAKAPAPPAGTAPASGAAVPAPAPAATAPPAADPPRSYPPPPPRWAEQPPIDYPFPQPLAQAAEQAPAFPYGPPPQPAPDGVSRRFSFTAAIGPGALIGPGERALALSYQVARVGLGLDPDIILQLSYEGSGTTSINPMTDETSWLKQDLLAAGLQHFIGPRIYLRGALGVGFVSEKTDTTSFSGGKGIAALAAFGYELMQRKHWSLGLDLHASLTHYPKESWKTFGLHLTVSVF